LSEKLAERALKEVKEGKKGPETPEKPPKKYPPEFEDVAKKMVDKGLQDPEKKKEAEKAIRDALDQARKDRDKDLPPQGENETTRREKIDKIGPTKVTGGRKEEETKGGDPRFARKAADLNLLERDIRRLERATPEQLKGAGLTEEDRQAM